VFQNKPVKHIEALSHVGWLAVKKNFGGFFQSKQTHAKTEIFNPLDIVISSTLDV